MPRPTHRNIYVRSQRAGERVMESITRFLTTKLKLKVNQAKSAVARPKDRKFLGFSFTGGKEARRRIAPKAILRFKARIRELTCRTRGISMAQRAKELSAYLRGWRGYFGFCQTPSVLEELDKWLRRRLRSAIWKQWKRGRKRYAELRQRGIRPALAAKTAGSPHGRGDLPIVLPSPLRCLRLTSTRLRSPGWLIGASSTRRTAVYGPVRTVVSQGQRVTAYLCQFREVEQPSGSG